MKNIKTRKGAIPAFLLASLAFTIFQTAAIKGTITPADAATNVWAITGKDTFSGSILENRFEFDKIKPGTYQIVVEASPPYKNGVKNDVVVKKDLTVDVGEIALEK
ncbi:MAG TPA: hypothetical protein PK339_03050 [Flavitalea sp.]|nr:hypothetical protein [Flavitalea sp.]